MTERSGMAEVNGTRLYYEVAGAPRRSNESPILFINPGALDCRAWDDQWAALARSHRVVRYDPRGWGRSDDVQVSFSPVEDLDALLTFLDVERSHLVGASWGAALALDYALLRPARVARLVLLGGAPSGVPIPPEAIEKIRPIVLAIREDAARGVEAWLETPGFGLPHAPPAVKARVRALALDNVRYWSIDPRLIRAADPPSRERLGEIAAPTLVLTGENEQEFLKSMADLLSRVIPHAVAGVIPAAGHLANLENPEAFNRLVLDFLDE